MQRPTRMLAAFAALVSATLIAARAGGTSDGADAALAAQGRDERPNVVVVMIDDGDRASMGALDSVRSGIAERGVTFENFFASFPVCSPSRASLLTGRYAHNHDVMGNKPPYGGAGGLLGDKSLPVALRRNGYSTAWIGKYLNGYGKRVREIEQPPGWSHFVAPVRGAHRYLDYALSDDGRIRRYGHRPRDYVVDVLAAEAERTLRRQARGDRPFVTVLSLLAPHAEPPGDVEGRLMNPRPPKRYRDVFRDAELPTSPSFDEADVSDKPAYIREAPLTEERRLDLRKRYRGRMSSLLAVDDAVERTLAALRRAGVEEDTYVVFVSDNGYMLGEHRLRAKTDLYEESVRVPMLIRGPGVPAGVVRSQNTANVDLAPTIYDITDTRPILVSQDGESLLPFAADPGHRADRAVLLENRSAIGVRVPGHVYVEHRPSRGARAYELYDLEADPYELENLLDPESGRPRTIDSEEADGVRALRARLAAKLDRLTDCEGSACAV